MLGACESSIDSSSRCVCVSKGSAVISSHIMFTRTQVFSEFKSKNYLRDNLSVLRVHA